MAELKPVKEYSVTNTFLMLCEKGRINDSTFIPLTFKDTNTIHVMKGAFEKKYPKYKLDVKRDGKNGRTIITRLQ